MLRCHVLSTSRREVKLPWNQEQLTVLSVAPLEIFASKTVALLTRTAPRDLYDIYNMIRYGLFDKSEKDVFRKCSVFYAAIGAEKPPEKFKLNPIEKISIQQIKRDLNPVLRKNEMLDLKIMQNEVIDYLSSILIPTEKEKNFWRAFANNDYRPELIFGESQELKNIAVHPMALWKCRHE